MVEPHGAGQGDSTFRAGFGYSIDDGGNLNQEPLDALCTPVKGGDIRRGAFQAETLDSPDPADAFAALVPQLCADHEKSLRQHTSHEMGFREYLSLLWREPERVVRSPAQYQVDAFKHYGFEEKEIAGKVIKDFAVRTFPWQSSSLDHRRELIGQEIPTDAYFRFCERAARDARPSSLVCIHGHSGSGKTTFFRMRDEMLEDFSRNHLEGALYRLVWRFVEPEAQRFGFAIDESTALRTHREKGELLIPADNNTDPLFVLPSSTGGMKDSKSPRELVLDNLRTGGRISETFNKDYFLADGLDPLSSKILSTLLDHYRGDMEKILDKHVRVERWYYASKLGEGIVSLNPNPDMRADIKPIHMSPKIGVRDEAFDKLPDLFSTGALYLRANRGVLHYSDMFRQNQLDRAQSDISRYNFLLETLESGMVQVLSPRDPTMLRNVPSFVFVSADTNDHNIVEKMQGSGFEQLRERMEFVPFGLITRFSEEARLYELAIEGSSRNQPSARSLETLALFACGTRLLSPDPFASGYAEDGLKDVIKKVTPVAKALLLDERAGAVEINRMKEEQSELSIDELRVLQQNAALVADEYSTGVGNTKFWLYDGGVGLSSRAGEKLAQRMILEADHSITAMDVCLRLREMVAEGLPYYEDVKRMRSQLTTQVEREMRAGGAKVSDADIVRRVHSLLPIAEPGQILDEVELYAKRGVQSDITQALGMTAETAAEGALLRYLWHVRSHLSGGNQEVPVEYRLAKMRKDGKASEVVMRDFEDNNLQASKPNTDEDRARLRASIFGQVAAWSLDNPGKKFDEHIGEALGGVLQDVRRSGRLAQKQAMKKVLDLTKMYGTENGELERDITSGDKAHKARAEKYYDLVTEMERLGYHRSSVAKEIVWALND